MTLISIEEPGQTKIPHEKEEIAVGIDLGTTNSLISIKEGELITIIPDEQGDIIQPSVVCFKKEGDVLVGREAIKNDGGKKIYSIKRLMNNPKKGDGIDIFGKKLSATEISAKILIHLKQIAEKHLDREVTKAVITVPAYFDEIAKNATKNAALIAGLDVLRLINEPTAAAVAYGLDQGSVGTYAIFDLGGGTFDVSILKLKKGVFKVIGVSGDSRLGGDDFDDLIVKKIKEGGNLENLSEEEEQNLKLIAKNIKEQLSKSKEFTDNSEIKGKNYKFSLTIAEFNQIIAKIAEKCINTTKNLIDDLDLEEDDIDGLVLVGGSTRTLLIQDKLKEIFGAKKILTNINPDKIVAMGAAIQGQALTSGSSNLLLDVIPLSLGVETMGGIVDKIIERNSTIPASYSKEFTTYVDGQTGIKLHITQGEREIAKDCRSLANFEIKNIPPLKAGVARIKVTFTIDADGLLTVSAKEETTGQIQKIEVKPSYGLDDGQIKDILISSSKNAKEDIKKRLLIEKKVEAERNILAINAAIKEDGELLTKEELENLQKQIKKLEDQLKTDNEEKIEKESENLETLAKNFAEKKMNKYVGKALKGKNVNDV